MSKIITISREFGSGGRTIGKLLSKELGIPCYDREIVSELSLKSGFSEEFIKNEGEYASTTNSFLFNLSQLVSSPMAPTLSLQQQLFILQSNLIKEIANREPCIIVGRCADYILKDRSDVFNVFVHASDEFRIKRIENVYSDVSKEPTQKRLKDKDAKRKVYYKNFTYRDWGHAKNYDLAIDTTNISFENATKIIASLVK